MQRRKEPALGWSLLAVAVWLASLAAGTLVGSPSLQHGVLTASTCVAALAVWARVRCRAEQRAAWSCFAVGLSGYAAGYAVLFYAPGLQRLGPGALNLSDCFSLLLYPGVVVGSALLLRERHGGRRLRALLDGGTVVTAVAALLLQWAAHAYPELVAAPALTVFLTIIYPVAVSALAVSMLAGVLGAPGRPGLQWWLLIAGFSVMSLGELAFMAQLAAGTFTFGTPLDAAFAAGPLGAALAAWARTDPPAEAAPRPVVGVTLPVLATVAALIVLADRGTDLPAAAIMLAVVAGLLAAARTVLFVGQEQTLVARTLEAATDPLTGLLNRRALLTCLTERLGGPGPTTLVLVDLDRFKQVKDSLGHVVGDDLLVQLSKRMSHVCPSDAVVARLGSDVFAVVVADTARQSLTLGAELVEVLAKTVSTGEHRVSVGASVGLATSTGAQALEPLELVRRADVALYRSKQERVEVEAWRPELDVRARDRLTLVADLRAALSSDGQLMVYLQPKCDTLTRRIVGFESLVRWKHPSRGMVAPDEFVAATERAGLMPRLTEKVLHLTLVEAAALKRDGRSVPLAVNVSAPDLLDVGFAGRVAAALEEHELPASVLRLEITETVVMSDPARVLTTLGLLTRLGIRLSLDDYGTGLSSLSYLRTLPVDELKIDRSFVARITTDQASKLIVTSTITLAHGLGLAVVAEGIEDEQTLQALADAGCDVVQGYLLGRPAPACDLVWPDPAREQVLDREPVAVPTLTR